MSDDELNRLMGILCGFPPLESGRPLHFSPATDANDALRVVEAMRTKGWRLWVTTGINIPHRVKFEYLRIEPKCETVEFHIIADFPRAICEAAAKAEGLTP